MKVRRETVAGVVGVSVIAALYLGSVLLPPREMSQGELYRAFHFGTKVEPLPTETQEARDLLQQAQRMFRSPRRPEAIAMFNRLIDRHSASNLPETQELVSKARFQLAYAMAENKDFEQAKEAFQEVAATYRGMARRYPFYGNVRDQAVWQAYVCEAAALADPKGKIAVFERFLREHPENPHIYAAYKRIMRLNGGDAPESTEDAMGVARGISEAAAKRIAIEQASCGASCLGYILRRYYGKDVDVNKLITEVHTTEWGATMADLAKGAAKHGVSAKGMLAGKEGLPKLHPPMILLTPFGHYTVVTDVTPRAMRLYDVKTDQERVLDLRALPDDWRAPILVLSAAPAAETAEKRRRNPK